MGGAEESLRKLTATTREAGPEGLIVNLGAGGALRTEFDRSGARVIDLGLSRIPSPRKLLQLRRIATEWKPDIIEGWMVHANVLAAVLRFARPAARVVWNVRSSLSMASERLLTQSLTSLGIALSHSVDAIVYNSARAAKQYQGIGYASGVTRVISNGFDTHAFAFGAAERRLAREQLGISTTAQIVGHVSRWHPDKDQCTLLDAFALVRQRHAGTQLILVGQGLDASNRELARQIQLRGLAACVITLGSVRPISKLYCAFDSFALTSVREGFPNVLGEALASGVQCVATDVGGCREVIGDASVYPASDAVGIAQGISSILEQSTNERSLRSEEARRRVQERFSIETMGNRYIDLYHELTSTSRGFA